MSSSEGGGVGRVGKGVVEVLDARTAALLARVDLGGTYVAGFVPLRDDAGATDGSVLALFGSGVLERWDLRALEAGGFVDTFRAATGFVAEDAGVIFAPR